MPGSLRRNRAGWLSTVALLAIAALLPTVFGHNAFVMGQFEYILAMVMVAIGLNLVTGYAGQLSLGPGAVFGMSAYVVVILANHYPTTVGLLLMCLLGIATAVLVGFVVGMPALRVGGFYLGMVTFFFALAIPTVAANLSLTGGNEGISLVSNLDFVQSPSGTPLFEVLLAVVAVLVLVSWLLIRSRVGRRLVTLRTSEELTNALGISGYRTKLYAFVLSAVPAGLGGAAYVFSQQFVSPDSMSTDLSIYLVAACVVGGLGTVLGPVVGGAIVLGLSQFLGGLAQEEGIIFGVALILVSVLIPEGVIGTNWRTAVRMLRRAPAATAFDDDPAVPGPTITGARRGAPGGVGSTTAGVPSMGTAGPHAGDPLRGEHLRRAFGGTVAVDDVSLAVRRGTLHALIGPNGSGKTTVLNLLSAFYELDGGEVWLGEERVDGHGPAAAARCGLGRTFQTPKLVPTSTAHANVLLGADRRPELGCSDLEIIFRLPRARRMEARANAVATDALALVGIEPLGPLLASTISHGGQRLVELARAVSTGAAFLLLDEPAAGLSPKEMDALEVALRQVVAAGIGVLLVEHNFPFVLRIADEITVLDHGTVVAHGEPDDIARNPDVARVYIGQAPLGRAPGGHAPGGHTPGISP